MGQRRMLSRVVTDSDMFLDMPASAQVLYFHLNMHADDDGFVGNTRSIMRMVGAANDDLKLLIAKKFVLTFDSGVIVIKDWRLHNTIRKDRHTPTKYQDEFHRLRLANDGSYQLRLENFEKHVAAAVQYDDNQMATTRQPEGNQAATQVKLSKVNISKDKEVHSPAKAEPIDYAKVIAYLNKKSGKHYRNTVTNRKLIKSRLDEGFTGADIKAAIDHVCQGWLGTEMARYIQPATIFRASKFEGYVNNVPGGGHEAERLRPARHESIPEWFNQPQQTVEQVNEPTPEEIAEKRAKLKEVHTKLAKLNKIAEQKNGGSK